MYSTVKFCTVTPKCKFKNVIYGEVIQRNLLIDNSDSH